MAKYLVTGAMGCIGAWVLYHLVKEGKDAVSLDLNDDRHRLDLLLTRDEQKAITFLQGDITDEKNVMKVFADQGITHVVHLAALQVPLVRANPVLGSRVNVTGTVNIFEAARETGVKHVTYASSMAVYGQASDYPGPIIATDAPKLPHTLYGVFKVANEGTADIYWQDHGISSACLRPYTVFGVGRDQGVTSEPTKAMLAAAKGEDYNINFGGRMQFHYASDVAQQFIECAETPLEGAFGFNLGTEPVAVSDVAKLIMELAPGTKITNDDKILPFAEGTDPALLHATYTKIYETPLRDAIEETINHFRAM